MAAESTQTSAAETRLSAAGRSYLEWGAVWAGAALATALSIILIQFGSGVGLAVGEPMLDGGGASWNVLVAGLWVVVVALASSTAGGYIAGRMRSRFDDASEDEVEFRDGAHGLTVWAVATIVVAFSLAVLAGLASSGAAVADAAAEIPADVARFTGNITSIFAFATAAGSVLGAAAAWFSATLGGQHRDQGTETHLLVPKPLRRRS